MKQIPSQLSQAPVALAKTQPHPTDTFTNTPEAEPKAVTWQGVFLSGRSHWICTRPQRCKAWRLLSLHQRSFHCLFYVLPTATPITADSHRQPAYSIQECTFAAYIHVLLSTKHYQNSRKERNWHTPDCSLKQFCKVCCCSQYRAESITSPNSYAFVRFKKGASALQQKNTQSIKKLPKTFP